MMRTATFLLTLFSTLLVLPASCTRTRDRVKVVILGFDGANWETIDPLIESGKLPYLERLKDEGAWGYLKTFKPTKSPVIWTSIATGKNMLKHGILDFAFIEENQIQVPYSNSERREPAIWEILDHYHLRSVVNNWFVTYPPDEINGVMVSNRFRKTLLVKGDRLNSLRDSVHPPQYFDELLRFANHDYVGLLEKNQLPDVAQIYEQRHPGQSHTDIPVLKDFRIYVLQEALNQSVSQHLYETEEFDFFASYFRLPDIVQHIALSLMKPELVDELQSRLRNQTFTEQDEREFQNAVSSVLEPFYRYMERIIESYVTGAPSPNTYFLIVSDHGFRLHSGGYDHYHIPDSYPPPDGFFLMKGPKVKGGMVPSISVYDIAPTILYVFDLASGKEMDGQPVTETLTLDRKVRYWRYSAELMKPKKTRRDIEMDKLALEELKSLGYIQ